MERKDTDARVKSRLGFLLLLILFGVGAQMAPGVIITLLLLTVCVAVHEYGHMLVMLRNGVAVKEYAIGFGPAVWQRKMKNGVVFSLRPIPLGGYVMPEGGDKGVDAVGTAKPWVRFKIAMAGMFMNALAGTVALAAMMWFYGMPVPGWFPGAGVIPWWLMPIIAAPIITFGLWLGTPILLVWIVLSTGASTLAGGGAGPIGIAQIGGSISMTIPISLIILKYLYLFWMVNVGLAGCNLLPIMPLDGSHIPGILIEKWYAWRRNRLLRPLQAANARHNTDQKNVLAVYDRKIEALERHKKLVLAGFRYVSYAIMILLVIAVFSGDIGRLIKGTPIIRL